VASLSPHSASPSGYWKKVRYRAGFRYHQTYLNLRENQLTEYGISFGLGLPSRRVQSDKSSINVGFEIGTRGTTENNLINETFFTVHVSLNIYDRWFYKRKYD
jgi:hypothetical protein